MSRYFMNVPDKERSEDMPNWLEIVRQQVDSLHFGVVQIVVHDSKVTQIDKTERVRIEKFRAKTL
jgi:hypothetical protein